MKLRWWERFFDPAAKEAVRRKRAIDAGTMATHKVDVTPGGRDIVVAEDLVRSWMDMPEADRNFFMHAVDLEADEAAG